MIDWLWRKVANIVTRPAVFAWIVESSLATPYYHLKRDAERLYMARWWFFNGYGTEHHQRRWAFLPSIRVHHIADTDQGPEHNHPWSARSIILKGWYIESREGQVMVRSQGDTFTLNYGEYHKIIGLSPKGCWTLFIMWKKQGDWGFKE